MTERQVSDYVAEKIRDARKQRGWTTGDLAFRCDLTDNIIENIESGRRDREGRRRRDITVDELLAVSRALDVEPIELMPSRMTQLDSGERKRQITQLMQELHAHEARAKKLETELTALQHEYGSVFEIIERYRIMIDQLQ